MSASSPVGWNRRSDASPDASVGARSLGPRRALGVCSRAFSFSDQDIRWLLERVISSFSTESSPGIGLPLGNLTSQLFGNLYLNEFDRLVKHKLRAKHYIRYADDFVFLHEKKAWLEAQIPMVGRFLQERLRLQLHPDKVTIETFASGVDFLGWVHFPDHRVLRTSTKRRMMRRLRKCSKEAALRSYLGLLTHGNAYQLRGDVLQQHWVGSV